MEMLARRYHLWYGYAANNPKARDEMAQQEETIERTEIPSEDMAEHLQKHLGVAFPAFESYAYRFMDALTNDYHGGQWLMYELDNGAFYMAPRYEQDFNCAMASNYYSGRMSPDAAGITVSLYALSHLAIQLQSESISYLFEKLQDYAGQHKESQEIFAAID